MNLPGKWSSQRMPHHATKVHLKIFCYLGLAALPIATCFRKLLSGRFLCLCQGQLLLLQCGLQFLQFLLWLRWISWFLPRKKSLVLLPILKIQTTKNRTKIAHVHKALCKLPRSCLVDVAKAAFTFVTVAWGFSKWRWPVSEVLGDFSMVFFWNTSSPFHLSIFKTKKWAQDFAMFSQLPVFAVKKGTHDTVCLN